MTYAPDAEIGKTVAQRQFLNGKRWHEEANIKYRVPISEFEPTWDTTLEQYRINFDTDAAKDVIMKIIGHHKTYQVPRLQELQRYLEADGNIHYRPPKKDTHRADNKIASDFANFVTAFNSGVVISNPIKYNVPTPSDDSLATKVDQLKDLSESASEAVEDFLSNFQRTANEAYLNKLIVNECLAKGRSYDLTYRNTYGEETAKMLPTEETFVIYDDTMDERSLCGVRYRYTPSYLGKSKMYVDIYAMDGLVYHFINNDLGKAAAAGLTLIEDEQLYPDGNPEDQYFDAVQITEYRINEDRKSVFEAVLDTIDAYDLSQSELANYQQDANEAYLVIKGNPLTGLPINPGPGEKDKQKDVAAVVQEVLDAYRDAQMIILGDRTTDLEGKPVGSEPDASYLVREYDADGAESYKKRLVADILRFTFVVDFTADQSLGSNETGIGMRFRGWGNDNQRKTMEQLLDASFKRRIRLLSNSWFLQMFIGDNEESTTYDELYDVVNLTTITFTPNIPKSDSEVSQLVTAMYNVLSNKTVYQIAEQLTGVTARDEEQRIADEAEERQQAALNTYPEAFTNVDAAMNNLNSETSPVSADGSDELDGEA